LNASQIFTNEEYAWYKNKPKGSNPAGAAKVKALSTKKVKHSWAKNASTEVEILILKAGTGYTMSYYQEGRKLWVPAREIMDFWDSYHDEQEMLRLERGKQQRLLEEERRQREEARHRAQTRVLVLQNLIGQRLVERGLPYGSVSLLGTEAVSIKVEVLLAWLGITDGEVDNAVDTVLGSDPEGSTTDGSAVLNPSGA